MDPLKDPAGITSGDAATLASAPEAVPATVKGTVTSVELRPDRATATVTVPAFSPDVEAACALIRAYKTHRYDQLDSRDREFALALMGGSRPPPGMRCR